MIITILPPQKVTRKMRIRNISNSSSNKSTRAAPRSAGVPSRRVTSSYNSEYK
jgi:hypothetical protein